MLSVSSCSPIGTKAKKEIRYRGIGNMGEGVSQWHNRLCCLHSKSPLGDLGVLENITRTFARLTTDYRILITDLPITEYWLLITDY